MASPEEPATYTSTPGSRLTPPSKAAPEAIVKGFLRGRGLRPETLVVTSSRRVGRTGITHLRMEQRIDGVRVHNAYVKAALNDAGELVHLIDAAARIDGAPAASRITAPEAVAAVKKEGPFHVAPSAEKVVSGNAIAWLVETWTERDNMLVYTLVDGEGAILGEEVRTNSDSYNVFAVSPDKTPQSVVTGEPGWLGAGSHNTRSISGNNVRAYSDADGNGVPDPGGAPVADGNFLVSFDPLAGPDVDGNRSVAVQNLFYLNNRIHDTLYALGFDEEAGNFQQDNFGKGGLAGDPVSAEAQDGGGTSNANFATPADGKPPRMQMYLWPLLGNNQVVVHAPSSVAATYKAQAGVFSPALTLAGLSGDVAFVNDGSTGDGTGTASDGCEALTGLEGKVAFLDRGLCPFIQKVKNAQAAGAIAVIVANNQGGDALMQMGGMDPEIKIPATFISQNDGAKLRAGGALTATVRLADPQPIARDGDLDSDIVWHEYGHGLTWRMIGGMTGPMSGALGEGMSDVLAIIMNEHDAVGEYSVDDPRGIRSVNYADFARSYGDFKGRGVHYEGELYGAIGWRLFTSFRAAGIDKMTLLGYIVDGMNYTKSFPAFEDMRDGILQAAAGTGHECLVWKAFAHFGVGVDARGVIRGPRIWIGDSKEVPRECK